MNNRSRSFALVVMAALAVYAAAAATGWQKVSALVVTAPASPAPLSVSGKQPSQAEEPVEPSKVKDRIVFTLYRTPAGEIACREATAAERKQLEQIDIKDSGLQPINHPELKHQSMLSAVNSSTGLTIVLRGTTQLQQNPAASAAFTAAAHHWEQLIMSPITVYMDVDYGATNFGRSWETGVLGSTSAPTASFPYQSVRTNLNAEAAGEGNAAKQSVFNALPAAVVPTDLGNSGSAAVSEPQARALGLLPAVAQSTGPASRIGFNSNFSFDFDPSDGITAGQTDFDAVATHEIGHALGFTSDAGQGTPRPSVWDLFRFRTGTTTGSFATANRVMTVGGSPDPLQFYFVPGNPELGLSNGGPEGFTTDGADGWQSSHWKHTNGCGAYIGIMDPAIPSGCRRTITSSDILALAHFGYNLTNSVAPPPAPPLPTPPPNDNFANGQTITGCTGSTDGSTFGATSETGEPNHAPGDTSADSPGRTIWYFWTPSGSGTTTITTAGSDFDTLLSVYTGDSLGSLTRVGSNDDVQLGVVLTSSVTLNTNGGTTYRIAVDGWGGDSGSVKLNWTGCVSGPFSSPTPTATSSPAPTSSSVIQFFTNVFVVAEAGGTQLITVTRTGDTSGTSSVDYRTTDRDNFTVNCAARSGTAFARCDFATVVSTLTFAPGEVSKGFTVPILDDSYAEGDETFSLSLSNPTGGSLGILSTTNVVISDNETADGTNPILQTNAAGISFFVRQHYLDFLGREPEPSEPWSSVLNGCVAQFNTDGNSPAANCDRLFVSGSFFGSPEFKDKGFYIIGMYRVAFNRLPTYTEFSVDLASISGTTAAEVFAKRAAYAGSFIPRTDFSAIYGAKTNADYVNYLMSGGLGQNYNLTSITTKDPTIPDTGAKVTLTTADLIGRMNTGALTRAQVLRAIAQSDEIVQNKEAVNSFVASQYYGYLRRTPGHRRIQRLGGIPAESS